MKRHSVTSSSVTAVALVFGGLTGTAHAANPTTADCLAASDASLKSGNDHKLRAERSQLLTCAAESCPADIRKECGSRIDELNSQIPTIIFQAKDAAGKELSAVKVTMDGEVLAERLQGTALSIDPGNHTFVFETAGQPPVSELLLIQQGERDRHERVLFGAAGAPAPVPPSPPPVTAPLAATPDLGASSPSPTLGTQKILAIVAGGVGVVGLGLGTGFGIAAISKKNDAQSVCPNVCANRQGADLWSDAKSAGNVSTAAFIVGAAALVGGAVLWFTAKPESESAPSPQVGLGLGTIQLKGSW